uniref:Uncharacterized protein n=1 Tax=Anopheles dirus TaxID=7168 RepID=A0A182NYB2_9DIPT
MFRCFPKVLGIIYLPFSTLSILLRVCLVYHLLFVVSQIVVLLEIAAKVSIPCCGRYCSALIACVCAVCGRFAPTCPAGSDSPASPDALRRPAG